MSDEVAALAMADWIAVLGDIPQQAVELACAEWLKNEDKRPTPAAIRRLALAHVTKPERLWPSPMQGPAYQPVTDKELTHRRQVALDLGLPVIKLKVIPKCEGD